MKLYTTNNQFTISYSLEDFPSYYSTLKAISQEALSDYLYKIKDSFSNLNRRLLSDLDRPSIDVTTSKFETLHKLKRINFVYAKEHITSKPENFKGKFVDYSKDLITSSKAITPNTEETLNNLKLAVASFINEYKDDKVFIVYGKTYFIKAEKLIEEHTKHIAKYFPLSNNSTKATIGDVLKTINDVEQLYKDIDTLGNTLSLDKINQISKLTKECLELIDSLIDQNVKTNVLANNNQAKKDLIFAIHTAAREVEFLNYLYSNVIMFYGVFKNLVEDLHKLAG